MGRDGNKVLQNDQKELESSMVRSLYRLWCELTAIILQTTDESGELFVRVQGAGVISAHLNQFGADISHR